MAIWYKYTLVTELELSVPVQCLKVAVSSHKTQKKLNGDLVVFKSNHQGLVLARKPTFSSWI